KNTTPRWPYRGRNGADDAAQEHHSVEVPGPLSSGDGCSDDATLLEPAEQTGAVAQLGGPAGTVSTSGITSAAKRSISSCCGLNCNSSRSTPARSNSRMRWAICGAVPTSPARSPRFDTE